MTRISLIAAIDENGGIGCNNKLLCHLPADLQYFKSTTMGKPIIMGRKTYESIGKPLPGRLNIVLSHISPLIEGVVVCNSLAQAMKQLINVPEVFILGGAQLFEECISSASLLYITKIHQQFAADAFFPEIKEELWHCTKKEFRPQDEMNKYDLTFYIYEPKNL